MSISYGSRDIVRNPSILRIEPNKSFVIEDKKSNKTLGVYLGVDLAKEFFDYLDKKKLLEAAKKIKSNSKAEYETLEESLADGL